MAINKTVNKRTNTHAAMRNCIEYVLQEKKIDSNLVTVTGPYDHEEINYDLVYQIFLQEKRLWNKDSGRMYAHNIISWHKDEEITPEEAFRFGQEFAEKLFSGFQTLISVHQDKDHIHCHLVTNSVSYENGKKLHTSKKDLERMKQVTNQMCWERGLTVAEKGKHFDGTIMEKGEVVTWNKDKYNLFLHDSKKSYVAECAMAVLSAMQKVLDRKQFINEMEKSGWEVNWSDARKHITFQNREGKKVRDSNLTKTFHLQISKGELEDEFIRNGEKQSIIRGARTARGTSKIDRRKSESANRVIENAETQSVFTEQQRRLEEQKRANELERAGKAQKRYKKRSEQEL